jgi:hypothetical protein
MSDPSHLYNNSLEGRGHVGDPGIGGEVRQSAKRIEGLYAISHSEGQSLTQE